jgi:hypothetical protein
MRIVLIFWGQQAIRLQFNFRKAKCLKFFPFQVEVVEEAEAGLYRLKRVEKVEGVERVRLIINITFNI